MILCIHRYIFLLNTLSGDKSCLVAPGVAVPLWATETVLSPWLAADEVRVSHVFSHVVWWKKLYKLKNDEPPKIVKANETHKILWDFEIQTDHLILARISDLVIINRKKRTFQRVNFAVLAHYSVKKKGREKVDKFLNLVRRPKTLWCFRVTVVPVIIWDLETVLKNLEKKPGGRRNRKNRDHPITWLIKSEYFEEF